MLLPEILVSFNIATRVSVAGSVGSHNGAGGGASEQAVRERVGCGRAWALVLCAPDAGCSRKQLRAVEPRAAGSSCSPEAALRSGGGET